MASYRPSRHVLSGLVAPFRYAGHEFQMIASYVGQMAPSGRIVITAALQAADEMRRIQKIASFGVDIEVLEPTAKIAGRVTRPGNRCA
jgi:methane/phenol/toluene hydroxylase